MISFKEYTKKALSTSINESISFRLKSALSINEQIEKQGDNVKPSQPIDENNDSKIVTTEEELEGFQIVKAILREKIPSSRIAHRDTLSYFGILLDDNNRKPLCRLHFNTVNKYLETFHNGKESGEKVLLNNLDEIYNYRNQIHQTLENYN
jgi:hypothetical protein